MLLDATFVNKQAPISVWLIAVEPVADDLPEEPNAIARARARRLRRMQSQNFIQRAAFEVVQLFKGHSQVA